MVSKDIWLKWPVGPGVGIGSSGSGGGLIAPLLTRTGTLKAEAAINDDVSKDGQGKGKLAACDICSTMLIILTTQLIPSTPQTYPESTAPITYLLRT